MNAKLTRAEMSLLLYLETQAVDYGGRLEGARMNADDLATAKRWNKRGYVLFGRIAANDISKTAKSHGVRRLVEALRLLDAVFGRPEAPA
jgi:hypothetical protein